MNLSVTILGSAGMFATTERAASGYLVRSGDTAVWLDAGAGSWRNLIGHIDYQDLGGIVLSHHHPDHTTDVFQAYHARVYGQAEALPTIPLWAPQETIDRCCAFAEGITDAFEMKPVSAGDSFEFADARFSFHDMAHPPDTVGVRVEKRGSVFAYSSDSGPGADFSTLIKDADLFICEATLQNSDDEWEGHMHASAAAEIASRYGVRHLVLTHLPPRRDLQESLDQAIGASEGLRVELAVDGKVYEI